MGPRGFPGPIGQTGMPGVAGPTGPSGPSGRTGDPVNSTKFVCITFAMASDV